MQHHAGIFQSKLLGAIVSCTLAGASSLAYAAAQDTIVSIDMIPLAQTLITGTTVQYQAIAHYSNGAIKDVTDTATWAVNNSGMSGTCASISATGLLTAGYCQGWGTTMTVSLGGVTTTGHITSTYGNSAQVVVSPGPTVISIDGTQQYTATLSQLNNASAPQNYTDKVTWSSSDPAVASISAAGLATGLAPGKTIITATSPVFQYMGNVPIPNTNWPIVLTVVPCDLSSITISPAVLTVLAGTTTPFKAQGTCGNGAQVDITNAASWQSTASNIATVSESGLAAGWAKGQATFTAAIGGMASLPVTVNVVDSSSLASITVTPQASQISKGNSLQFKAVGTYQDGSSQDITDAVDWSSNALGIVTVSATGQAAGLTPGNALVTATNNGLASTAAEIAVTNNIASIAITPASVDLKELGVQPLQATATYQDNSTQDITGTATWATSAPGIVNFNGAGLAYGVAKGSATLSAISNGVASPGIPVTVK